MQPTNTSNRILLPVRPWFIVFSLAMALFVNMIPVGRLPGVPDLAMLVLVFWCIHQPFKVGMGSAFVLGLLMDVVDGSVMGQHALAYVPLAYIANGLSRRIMWFPLLEQALQLLPMLLGAQLIMMTARMMAGGAFPGLLWFSSSITGALIWHPLTYLLLLPQFQPVERDENRPI